MSDFNFASCPPPPTPSPEEYGKTLQDIIKASGIQACRTDNTQVGMKYTAEVKSFLANASVGASFDYNNTSTLGCEQVVAITKKYKTCVQNVSCVLNQVKSEQIVQVNAGNKILIEAGRDINYDCKALKIKQSGNIKLIALKQMSSASKNAISAQTKSLVNDIAKITQDSYTQAGATPQGSKIFQDLQSKLDQIDYSANVSQVLDTMSVSLGTNNEIVLRAGRDLIVKGDQCEMTQEIIIDVLASNIVNNVVESAMEQLGDFVNTTSSEAEQKK